jgi:hypothetical protein
VSEQPYNPLSRENLGKSVAEALLRQAVMPMPPANRRVRASRSVGLPEFSGAGIYALYYVGRYQLYERISKQNSSSDTPYTMPIYVGKADLKGARTGIYNSANTGSQLYERLCEHSRSIHQVNDLDLDDFRCKYLIVEDIWIPLGESLLINQFKPVWNKFGGFGIHQPGGGRERQKRSIWDTLHPGRALAANLPPNELSKEYIESLVRDYLQNDTSIRDIEPEA